MPGGGAATPPGPPICVHGPDAACDNAEESRLWDEMIDRFRAWGYPEGHLRALHGAAKVDIVAHSMGALTARLHLLEGHENVGDFIAIGGGAGATSGAVAGKMTARMPHVDVQISAPAGRGPCGLDSCPGTRRHALGSQALAASEEGGSYDEPRRMG
jgi:pimeloyl-ACP methyl ester carboxylesterase